MHKKIKGNNDFKIIFNNDEKLDVDLSITKIFIDSNHDLLLYINKEMRNIFKEEVKMIRIKNKEIKFIDNKWMIFSER